MFFHTLSSKKAHERISNLEEEFERLQREFKGLQLEWENSYDKLRTLMGRIAKRTEAMHEKAESEGLLAPGGEKPSLVPNQTHGGALLTDNQKKIQQNILRRRAGG